MSKLRCGMVMVTLIVMLMGVFPSVVAQSRVISGRVTDVSTGNGISNAQVYVADTNQLVTTDSNGNYTVSVSGTFAQVHVVVTHGSYAKAHNYGVPVPSTWNVTLTTAQGTINVTVRDKETGLQVSGFEVVLIADSTEGTGFNSTTTTTGYGTLNKLAPMIYYVHAYPGTESGYYPTRISGVEVSGNGSVQAATIYISQDASELYAQVVDQSGTPVSGALVYLNGSAQGGGTGTCSTSTNSTGHFSCFVSGGNYDVHISGVSGYPNFIDYTFPIPAGQQTLYVFHLHKGNVVLAGQVTNKAGEPLSGIVVEPFPWFDPGTWGTQTTDSQGRFSFTLLKSGEYQIFVHATGYQGIENPAAQILIDGQNVVNFELVRDTALLVVSPRSYFLLGESDAPSIRTISFDTANGGASGTADWTSATVAVTPSGIMTVTTPSGGQGDPVVVQIDPRGLTVGQTYTGTLTVVGSGDSGTRQVPIQLLSVQDIWNVFFPLVLKSYAP